MGVQWPRTGRLRVDWRLRCRAKSTPSSTRRTLEKSWSGSPAISENPSIVPDLRITFKNSSRTVKKINTSKLVFKMMENLENFNQACKAYGVPEMETFQAVDLTERVNLHQVVLCCNGLARKAQSMGLRGFGPKEADQNKRDFSEETLKAGQSVIGLQMGSNQGATQSGQNFGNYRHM